MQRACSRFRQRNPNLFIVDSLFANNEQGAWYDPSDMNTIFQDSTGSIPAVTSGQPVGLVLDKSRGLVRGPELRADGVTAIVGVATAATYNTTTGDGSVTRVDVTNQSGVTWTGLSPSTIYDISLTVNTGSLNMRSGGLGDTVPIVLAVGARMCKILSSASGQISITSMAGTSTFSGVSIKELPGNHATQTTSASRPTFRDVGGIRYLEFDGVDDFLLTGTVSFTATDKMSMFAGLRKLSDAAVGAVAELSVNPTANNGTFSLTAPGGAAAATVNFDSRGNATSTTSATGLAAPISVVVSTAGDISGDVASIRANGVAFAPSATDQGAGNYGNYPIYIGRRGGTTLPFNGHLYGLVVRGALTDDATIANTERYMAAKTGVTLT